MGNKIIIKDLKGVKEMTFVFPGNGVHVISAANGSGKTTLLVCLERIVNSRALNDNFTQHNASNVDPYHEARITYQHTNGAEITYTYRETSDTWKATTRKKNVLENAYTSIQYMPTLGKRVYIQSNARSKKNLVAAKPALRKAMAEVLEDDKFLKLLKGNIGETRGRKGAGRRENSAYRLPLGKRTKAGVVENYYYSELSFSLGEIFVLNLLHRIQNIEKGSLLLVDELEVALHPRVQYKLLKYLERISEERSLTVLVSTHSSSLIKCASNLIFLERDDTGEVDVHYNCYPTYALRDVGILEEINPDYVFYVEDRMAEYLLKAIIKKYFRFAALEIKPLWKVLPVGGYVQVLNFAKKSKDYLLPSSIGQYIFLDNDVIDEKNQLSALGNGRNRTQQRLFELFTDLDSRTRYLEITPELGLWNWIETEKAVIQTFLDERYDDVIIDFDREIRKCNEEFPTPSANLRKDAKHKVSWICNHIGEMVDLEKVKFANELIQMYCDSHFSIQAERNKLMQLFGPIFSNRGNP